MEILEIVYVVVSGLSFFCALGLFLYLAFFGRSDEISITKFVNICACNLVWFSVAAIGLTFVKTEFCTIQSVIVATFLKLSLLWTIIFVYHGLRSFQNPDDQIEKEKSITTCMKMYLPEVLTFILSAVAALIPLLVTQTTDNYGPYNNDSQAMCLLKGGSMDFYYLVTFDSFLLIGLFILMVVSIHILCTIDTNDLPLASYHLYNGIKILTLMAFICYGPLMVFLTVGNLLIMFHSFHIVEPYYDTFLFMIVYIIAHSYGILLLIFFYLTFTASGQRMLTWCCCRPTIEPCVDIYYDDIERDYPPAEAYSPHPHAVSSPLQAASSRLDYDYNQRIASGNEYRHRDSSLSSHSSRPLVPTALITTQPNDNSKSYPLGNNPMNRDEEYDSIYASRSSKNASNSSQKQLLPDNKSVNSNKDSAAFKLDKNNSFFGGLSTTSSKKKTNTINLGVERAETRSNTSNSGGGRHQRVPSDVSSLRASESSSSHEVYRTPTTAMGNRAVVNKPSTMIITPLMNSAHSQQSGTTMTLNGNQSEYDAEEIKEDNIRRMIQNNRPASLGLSSNYLYMNPGPIKLCPSRPPPQADSYQSPRQQQQQQYESSAIDDDCDIRPPIPSYQSTSINYNTTAAASNDSDSDSGIFIPDPVPIHRDTMKLSPPTATTPSHHSPVMSPLYRSNDPPSSDHIYSPPSSARYSPPPPPPPPPNTTITAENDIIMIDNNRVVVDQEQEDEEDKGVDNYNDNGYNDTSELSSPAPSQALYKETYKFQGLPGANTVDRQSLGRNSDLSSRNAAYFKLMREQEAEEKRRLEERNSMMSAAELEDMKNRESLTQQHEDMKDLHVGRLSATFKTGNPLASKRKK